MSKSNATELDLLNYIFKKTAFPWDAVTNLELHLHTADPGEAGITTTSSNAALIQFPQCTGGSNTITHLSVAPAGSTQILYSGALNSPLSVSNLVQPQFSVAALQFQED